MTTRTILRGATVIDGTGAPGTVTDVVVADGVISSAGPVTDTDDATVVDLSGLALAPGFILGTSFHNTHTTPEAAHATVATIPLGRAGTASWLPNKHDPATRE